MITKQVLTLPCDLYFKRVSIFQNPDVPLKASVLYFHGGGLLYGSREDLPDPHLQILTDAGFAVIAFDYPLSPGAKLPDIFADVCASIEMYLSDPALFSGASAAPLPYFLFGRSAGAYLCLLAAGKGNLSQPPAGMTRCGTRPHAASLPPAISSIITASISMPGRTAPGAI